ncbi:MAG TPA: hypothetical protein VM934_01885 [Pyrinomonadaceae bacterium]|jgi:hypothetical protein|nr:hypothetical protein [Pyrinomonadaceae bacterium]
MIKKITFAILCLILSAGAVTVLSVSQQDDKRTQPLIVRNDGSLHAYVNQARSNGQSRIVKPGPLVEYATYIRSLKTALSSYWAVVASPIEKHSITKENGDIRTWYKFRILESINPQKYNRCSDCPAPAVVPAEMLPLQTDEILLSERGGTVNVEGIEIVTPPEFGFELSEQYLLFLQEDQSGFFGRLMVGPDALFKVAPDNSLTAINEKPHTLKKIVKEQFKDSLAELKNAAKQQR